MLVAVFPVVSVLLDSWRSGGALLAGMLFSAGPAGTLVTIAAMFVFGGLDDRAHYAIFIVAALVQWVPLWALGMRSLSPRRRPRRWTFLLVFVVFISASVVSAYGLTRVLHGAYAG